MSLCHQASANPRQAILTRNQVRFLIFLIFLSKLLLVCHNPKYSDTSEVRPYLGEWKW